MPNMRIRTITLIITVWLLIIFSAIAFAHPGNTDGKGGHYNRSTGEYHYHHGYSEHQHPNGECPYSTKSVLRYCSNTLFILCFISIVIALFMCVRLNNNKAKKIEDAKKQLYDTDLEIESIRHKQTNWLLDKMCHIDMLEKAMYAKVHQEQSIDNYHNEIKRVRLYVSEVVLTSTLLIAEYLFINKSFALLIISAIAIIIICCLFTPKNKEKMKRAENCLIKEQQVAESIKGEYTKLFTQKNAKLSYNGAMYIAGVPKGTILSKKGLPCQSENSYGEWTRYLSDNGKVVHRKAGCSGAYFGVHAYEYAYTRRCQKCNPEEVNPPRWYYDYQMLIKECNKHNITLFDNDETQYYSDDDNDNLKNK